MLLKFLIVLLFSAIEGFVHHKTVREDLENHRKSENIFYTSAPTKGHIPPEVCSRNASCVRPVQCPAHFKFQHMRKCILKGGAMGICCSSGQHHTIDTGKGNRGSLKKIRRDVLKEIRRFGREKMLKIRSRSVELLELDEPPILAIGSPSYGHFRTKRVFGEENVLTVMGIVDKAMEMALATEALKDREGILAEDIEWNLLEDNLSEYPFEPTCILPPECPEPLSPFRKLDGSCNNNRFPLWGSGLSPFSRLLPPKYHDGIWLPRKSVYNVPLPSPRLISSTIFEDLENPDEEHTLMVMQFGQFISHEITQSLDFTFPNGTGITCCGPDDKYVLPEEMQHHACMPITVPETDEFLSKYDVKCINFVRSVLAPRFDCTLGYTQQMNKVTHFMDASAIYGSNIEHLTRLRDFEGGRLKSFEDFGRDLLPLAHHKEACLTMERGTACFESGDSRTNQMISLVAIHMLFMREHNRIAGILEELNDWPDERIFLEARKILIAELQIIVYKEFLPAILGEIAMEEFDLNLEEDGFYSDDYDDSTEPSITNEFASAAYRFGHSTVNGILNVYGTTKMDEMLSIPEVMFYPGRMRKVEFFDKILSSLTIEPMQKVDNYMADALTKYMFRAGNPFGVDLASLNIQRGRDHGIRPYNHYRILVGLEPIKDFVEFGKDMGEKLGTVYRSPDDIDLWIGGLLEEKAPGSILGITFRDIIADQFSRLKRGDRYFFENNPKINPGYFTLDQLHELKKVTLSRIICDNSDKILLVRQGLNAFKKPGLPGNEFRSCDSNDIPRVNLMLWKEF